MRIEQFLGWRFGVFVSWTIDFINRASKTGQIDRDHWFAEPEAQSDELQARGKQQAGKDGPGRGGIWGMEAGAAGGAWTLGGQASRD